MPDLTDLEKDAFEFFIVFSKAEYVLKNSEEFSCCKDGELKPDWNKFKSEDFNLAEIFWEDKDIKSFMKNPPRKQKCNKEFSSPQEITLKSTKLLIEACCTLRNNTFHGTKFSPNPDKEDRGRNLMLLNAGTKIIKALINAKPETALIYSEGKL